MTKKSPQMKNALKNVLRKKMTDQQLARVPFMEGRFFLKALQPVLGALLIFCLGIHPGLASAARERSDEMVKVSGRRENPVRIGVVVKISDGDTVTVDFGSEVERTKVRIEGIDAPEICQEFGKESQAVLLQYLFNQRVSVELRGQDVYGRSLGYVQAPTTDGRSVDVGYWMVSNGFAWAYAYKGKKSKYATEEKAAREARLGLWGYSNPMSPNAFRKKFGSCSPTKKSSKTPRS